MTCRSFRDVLLTARLRKAIKKINLDNEGEPWLDNDRINEVVSRLERISAPKLLEANKEAYDLIVQVIEVAGDSAKYDGREKSVAFIDFEHPEKLLIKNPSTLIMIYHRCLNYIGSTRNG